MTRTWTSAQSIFLEQECEKNSSPPISTSPRLVVHQTVLWIHSKYPIVTFYDVLAEKYCTNGHQSSCGSRPQTHKCHEIDAFVLLKNLPDNTTSELKLKRCSAGAVTLPHPGIVALGAGGGCGGTAGVGNRNAFSAKCFEMEKMTCLLKIPFSIFCELKLCDQRAPIIAQ